MMDELRKQASDRILLDVAGGNVWDEMINSIPRVALPNSCWDNVGHWHEGVYAGQMAIDARGMNKAPNVTPFGVHRPKEFSDVDETHLYNCGGIPVELVLPEGEHFPIIQIRLNIIYRNGYTNRLCGIHEPNPPKP